MVATVMFTMATRPRGVGAASVTDAGVVTGSAGRAEDLRLVYDCQKVRPVEWCEGNALAELLGWDVLTAAGLRQPWVANVRQTGLAVSTGQYDRVI